MNQDARLLLRIGIVIVVFVLTLVAAFWLSARVWDIASAQCPSDTFTSGKVYFFWDGLTESLLFAIIFLPLMSALARLPPFTAKDRERFSWYFGTTGTVVTLLFIIASAAALWYTSSTPLCLADSGIYHRTAPWHDFQRHAWTDVTKLDVDCRNRGESPDLYYVVTMKDGTNLDVGDALHYRAFGKFRAQLANVPITFAAKIDRSCPDWYSDWAGQKP